MRCSRYVYYIDFPKGCKFFWKVLSFYTYYTLSVPPHKPLSTGSILGSGASRASPGIIIGRTAIVVIRTAYMWSYFSVLDLPVRLRSRESNLRHRLKSFSHHPKTLALSFWTYSFKWVPNHQEPEKHRKNPLALAGNRTQAAWLTV